MSVRLRAAPHRDPVRGQANAGSRTGETASRRRLDDPALNRVLDAERRRGRGTTANPGSRFEVQEREAFHDGWDIPEEEAPFETEVREERIRSLITKNDSPDVAFDRSVNPYRGCEHGCTYCFARPFHGFLGLSSGLDFETKLFAKVNAPEVLERELQARGYNPATLALGTATDPYQPIERRFRLTRSVLDVLRRANHPVGIVTKSGLVTRDIDILAPMADLQLAKVAISVTTLDPRLARRMEPRAPTPSKRLEAIRTLSEAGIPVSVLVAPVVPGLNDHEIEEILRAAYAAGAREAGYVLLRLPHEVKDLFRDWLDEHYPDKARHVMSLVQETRGGRDYDPAYGRRMGGVGPYAWMLGRRFETACARFGLNQRRLELRTDLFSAPARQATAQLSLF